MSKNSTVICFCHPDTVDAWFVNSLLSTLREDQVKGHRRIRNRTLAARSGPMVDKARNQLVKAFLALPDKPEWMLMVDTDMVWFPEDFDELIKSADPIERPIMGGLCFAYSPGKVLPTVFRFFLKDNQMNSRLVFNYPRNEVYRCDATGMAFCLIHRSVLVAIEEKYGHTAAPWFAFTYSGDVPFGEDVTFCMRAQQLGFPVHVNTSVKIGHMKNTMITEANFDNYLATLGPEDLEGFTVQGDKMISHHKEVDPVGLTR